MTAAMQRRSLAGLLAWRCSMVSLIATIATTALGQSAGGTRVFDNPPYKFSIALPADCQLEEGPGTIDATCSPDREQGDSGTASSKLTAFVLQVSAETVADDSGKTSGELAQRYTEAMFKAELPEAVCGESDSSRTKLQNVTAAPGETGVVYTAEVVCAGVRFLQVPERRASVRYIIDPAGRYRLIARATSDDFEKERPKIEAFLASFAITSASK